MIVWRKVGVWVLGRARMKRIQVSEYAVLYLFFLWLLGSIITMTMTIINKRTPLFLFPLNTIFFTIHLLSKRPDIC